MKVTVEGTAEELLDLAELLTLGRTSRRAIEVPKHTNASARDVRAIRARDEMPNRFREEGV